MRKYKLIKLNPEGLQRWSNAKVRLQWTVPSFMHLFYKMLNKDDTDQLAWFTSEIETLATDGVRILINPNFFFPLTEKQQTFAVCHEIDHAMKMHPALTYAHMSQNLPVLWAGKALPFHPKIANYARDFCINAELVAAKIGEIHPDWLYNEKIATADTCWQEAYHNIFEECESFKGAKPDKGAATQIQGEGDNDLPSDPGDRDPYGLNPRFEPGHLPPGATEQKPASDPDVQADPQRWQQAIMGALAVGRAAGNLPQSIEKAMEALLKPQITWSEHIEGELARKVNGHGYDFRRLDRRLISRGIGAPGKSGKGCGTIVVAPDASGSIYGTPMLIERFFAELAGIFEMLNPKRIVVLWWDTEVQRVDEIEDSADLMACYYKGAEGGGGPASSRRSPSSTRWRSTTSTRWSC